MKCPSCSHSESKVIDSRPSSENSSIRRRRECLNCQKRFTTYETIETVPIIVIKKDKSRESFDRNKIFNSIIRACDKRQITRSQMETIVDEIEAALQNALQNEVSTAIIGEMVMKKLKVIDEVAYVRFASVYRQFRDIGDFMDELKNLLAEK
ncbi:MAG: transcriptional regulator NrdR [Clostridiales bacterium GWF2_36_10]|nr:MAG: transcriptional regulator NrdR [Clostridiales bacterium GWF2_36_10]HAN21504.1 transcriptional regulator NrdR [Clostridiales bacterium]